jgi:hypothetical protein
MNRLRSLAALLCIAAVAACDERGPQDITAAFSGARIKFYNFGLNAPSVNFYANETKLTGTLSTTGAELTTGTAYGSVGSAGFYSELAPGQYTLSSRITATTDKDLSIADLPATIVDGKSYSFYLSGPYSTTTKKVDAFLVEDPLPAAMDYTVAYVRFVNAISNANPMTLYARNTTTAAEVPLGATVAYKTAGAFTALPAGVYDLGARVAGSGTNAIARTAVSFDAGRVYTISGRGDMTITSTTATNRPFLDNTANR